MGEGSCVRCRKDPARPGPCFGIAPRGFAAAAGRGRFEEHPRSERFDTSEVDDVILGVADPVNEQGADIARTAVLVAGYDQGTPGVQINRFCASGLEAGNMAGEVMSGQLEIVIGGGVESMSRIEMFSSGGALRSDPHFTLPHYFVPQRHFGRSDRDRSRLFPRPTSTLTPSRARGALLGMVGRSLRASGGAGA